MGKILVCVANTNDKKLYGIYMVWKPCNFFENLNVSNNFLAMDCTTLNSPMFKLGLLLTSIPLG